MRAPERLALIGVWVMVGCDFPLSTSKYEVDPELGEGSSYTELVEAFAGDSVECAACLRVSCGVQLRSCVEASGCQRYAECQRAEGHPGSWALCGELLDVSLDVRVAYYRLHGCWASCSSQCLIGQDFSCVGEYAEPRPARSPIVLSQTLRFLNLAGPLEGARVRVCPRFEDCEIPLAEATTGAQGSYAVEVPILLEPGSLAGFRGYRLVDGPETGALRLEANIPRWSDHYEETAVLHDAGERAILENLGVRDRSVIFAQVFDCQDAGAGDIVLELPDSEGARVRYLDARNPLSERLTATSSASEGAAVIYGLAPRRIHHVVARHAGSGDIVTEGSVFVSGEHLVFFSLRPRALVP